MVGYDTVEILLFGDESLFGFDMIVLLYWVFFGLGIDFCLPMR
jgi:hypothetical protein